MEATYSYAKVMTLSEAASYVRVSEKTLRKLATQGKVPAHKVGREWRFLASALRGWLGAIPGSGDAGTGDSGESGGQVISDDTTAAPAPRAAESGKPGFGDSAFTENRDKPLHRWVPWIAGFSGSFVNEVLDRVADRREPTVLDPFAGVGTTLVEGMKRGFNVVGFEINPYAALACRVKMASRHSDVGQLRERSAALCRFIAESPKTGGVYPSAHRPGAFVSRVPFFSPRIEPQVLLALEFIAGESESVVADFLRVALGATMVGVSNYSYEPSLSRREVAGKSDILDADLAGILGGKLGEMCDDVEWLQKRASTGAGESGAVVWPESYLSCWNRVPARSVDVLVTSPPYLNNYHYIRNTRPQLYWLGLVAGNGDLRGIEQDSFGKFWQTVRSGPPVDLGFSYPVLEETIGRVGALHPEKGAYGGQGWANYAATYFNDCQRFCEATLKVMKPGGLVVVVIGNNILQGIELRTDEFFAGIAEKSGFVVAEMHRVRSKRTGSSIINSSIRVGTNTQRAELHETAVELRAPY